MLFMSIYTFKPENRDEVIKRRMEKGLQTPEGAKCLGQWSSASGLRAFTLFEVNDGLTHAAWSSAWTDLGEYETYAVVETEELLKVLAEKMKQ